MRPISVTPVATGPVRLLYVDDLEANLFAMSQLLGDREYALDLARTTDDAFRFLLKHSYACILCDVQMPGLDGYQLVKLIRADPEHANTPVLFITAHDTSDTRMREAFELGACDYITKPVDAVALRAKLYVFAELSARARALAAEKERFYGAMSSLSSGVLIAEGGAASYLNPAFEQLWGRPVSLASARQVFSELELYDAERQRALPPDEHPFRRAFEGKATEETIAFLQKGGGAYWALSVTRVESRSGVGDWRTVTVVRDVTAAQLGAQALRGKVRDLEQFAYAASHDLRAPIRHIAAFAGILSAALGESQSPEVAEALGVIGQATDEMRVLVDGLLALSLSGAQALKIEPIALKELSERMWHSHGAGAVSDAEFLCDGKLPTLWADSGALQRIISNLIINAIKFRSPERPLRITVAAEDLAVSHRIVIRDNGIGISPAHRDRVFMVFQRLHPKGTYEGSGIGLALCRQLVELHGGTIRIESNEGPGTAVVLEWPRKPELQCQ